MTVTAMMIESQNSVVMMPGRASVVPVMKPRLAAASGRLGSARTGGSGSGLSHVAYVPVVGTRLYPRRRTNKRPIASLSKRDTLESAPAARATVTTE